MSASSNWPVMPGDCPNLHTLVLFYRAQGGRDMRAKKMQISKILDDGGPFVIWEKEFKVTSKRDEGCWKRNCGIEFQEQAGDP